MFQTMHQAVVFLEETNVKSKERTLEASLWEFKPHDSGSEKVARP